MFLNYVHAGLLLQSCYVLEYISTFWVQLRNNHLYHVMEMCGLPGSSQISIIGLSKQTISTTIFILHESNYKFAVNLNYSYTEIQPISILVGERKVNRAKCFLAYCWDDSNFEDLLRKIKNDIERKSQNSIEVILDKISFEISDNFRDKEKLIQSCDCVVVFFSPNFNRILLNEETHRGVHREYQYIKDKFLANHKSVIPVLLTGERVHAIPKEFKDIIGYEMQNIVYENRKQKIVVIGTRSKNYYSNMLHQIIVRVNNIHRAREYQFSSNEEKYEILLRNTSADGNLLQKCMIKMNAYDQVVNQRSFLIVGRKGSGKSTFLETLGKLDASVYAQHYKDMHSIYVENIDVNAIYLLVKNTRSDETIFPMSDITDMFWRVLFVLQGIFIVCTEVELYVMDGNRKKEFQTIARLLKSKLGLKPNDPLDQTIISANLPALALELMTNYLQYDILSNANYETLQTSIKVNFTVMNIMASAFGARVFTNYIKSVKQCKKKILISLDGFDTYSEDFRRNTFSLRNNDHGEYCARLNFEATFYRSLIKTATEFKRAHFGNLLDILCNNTDFCLVLPQDRWDQIKEFDRDISKRKYCGLFWNPMDLLKMVVFRLENYYEIEGTGDLHARWCHLLSSHLKGIPEKVKVRINGRDTDFDLFNYILRLSFWRPRDILLHLIGLLDLHDEFTKNDISIDDDTIKNALARSSRKIIDEEFILEYQNVFYNLKEVLNVFQEGKLIYSFSDFCSIITKVRFDASFAYDNNHLESKLSILYQLGIIGLYYTDSEWAHKQYSYHICFYFKDGFTPMRDHLDTRNWSSPNVKIIINPIFSKYLNLDYSGVDEAICNYTWEEFCKIRIIGS